MLVRPRARAAQLNRGAVGRARHGHRAMSADTHKAQASSQPPRKAPPVGRALRLLVGLLLIVHSLLHIVVSRRLVALGSGLGALLGLGILVALYLAGGLGGPFLGRGEG